MGDKNNEKGKIQIPTYSHDEQSGYLVDQNGHFDAQRPVAKDPKPPNPSEFQGLLEKCCIGVVIILLILVIGAISSILISTFQSNEAGPPELENPYKTTTYQQPQPKDTNIPIVPNPSIKPNPFQDLIQPDSQEPNSKLTFDSNNPIKPDIVPLKQDVTIPIPDQQDNIEQPQTPVENHERIEITDILQPITDTNQYKVVILENQLKVLLVSDPHAEMAMAAMDVHAGSWLQPDSVPGLAHFLEHMSFISSETYPQVGYVDDFLSTTGGYSNAYTDDHHTNYYCVTSQESFDETASIFAHMFIDPQFPPEAVDKQASAVNSEYEIDTNQDVWKYQLILSLIARQDHPFSRFTIGNTETLKNPKNGAEVVLELENFHNQYYSSNIMSLVLYSSHSISELEQILDDSNYRSVPNRFIERPNLSSFGLPFDKDELPKFVKLEIQENNPVLKIVVMVEVDEQDEQKRAPELLEYLLSYSGEGGMEQTLKQLGLIDDLDIGMELQAQIFVLFAFSFDLTEQGFTNPSMIISEYFNFIHKLRQTPSFQKQYTERKKMMATFFNYLEISGGSPDYVSNLSVNLNNGDPKQVLASEFIYEDYDQSFIEDFFSQFDDPHKLTFIMGSPSFDGEFAVPSDSNEIFNLWTKGQPDQQFQQHSSLYNINYTQIPIDADELNQLKKYIQNPDEEMEFSKIQFPPENIFSPDDSLKMVNLCDIDPSEQKYDVSILSSIIKNDNDENWFQVKQEHINTIPNPEHTHPGPRADEIVDTTNQNDPNISNYQDFDDQIDPLTLAFTPNGEAVFPVNSEKELENRPIVTFGFDDPYLDENYYQQFVFVPFPFEEIEQVEEVADQDAEKKTPQEAEDLRVMCLERDLLYEENFKYPELIVDDYFGRIWYKLDRSYQVPEIMLLATFSSPKSFMLPKQYSLIVLYTYLLEEEIRKDFGQAMEAGYTIEFDANEMGLNMKIGGWSDQFAIVVNKTVSQINEYSFSEDEVIQAKELAIKHYTSQTEDDLLRQISRIQLPSLLVFPYHTPETMLSELNKIKQAEVEDFRLNTLTQFRINSLIVGNVDVFNAGLLMEDAIDIIDTSFHSQQDTFITSRVINVIGYSFVTRSFPGGNDDNLNSATINYYQWGPRTMYNLVMMAILEVPLNLFMFKYLRTDRELGYTCFAMIKRTGCVDSFIIGVQGSKLPPHQVDQEIENALIEFRGSKLESLDFGELESMKEAAAAQFKQDPQSLEEKAQMFGGFIQSGSHLFDEQEEVLKYLEKVNENNLRDFFDEMFINNPGQVSNQLYSKATYQTLPEDVIPKENTIHGLDSFLITDRQDLVNSGRTQFNCDISFKSEEPQTVTL